MKNRKVAFIGGGNMTRAIVGGLIDSEFAASDILIAEPVAAARMSLAKDFSGVSVSGDNHAVAESAGCVVLSVKPQVLPAICRELRDTAQQTRPLIVSIAAGTHSAAIDAWLGGDLSVIRIMPNQPALLRLGVSGLYANNKVSDDEREYAAGIIAAVGSVVHVENESDIDAVTAVSGSGPAYFFLLIDMLMKSAVDLGISENAAKTLAIETAVGAAALAKSESESMKALIERVRSPGGTTAAALDSLENAGVRDIFSAAITAACDRAKSLADEAQQNQD